MRPDDRTRIRHLREAATKAVNYGVGKQRSDLDGDELLRLALTKLVEIVGEVAKSVTPEGRAALPAVPWRAAARTRDRLVHHYFDINLDLLWQRSPTISFSCSLLCHPSTNPTNQELLFWTHQPWGMSWGRACKNNGVTPIKETDTCD